LHYNNLEKEPAVEVISWCKTLSYAALVADIMAHIYLCKECKSYRRSIRNRWKTQGTKAYATNDATCKHCTETAELKAMYGDNRTAGKLTSLDRLIKKMDRVSIKTA
jgi:hypothetical protein